MKRILTHDVKLHGIIHTTDKDCEKCSLHHTIDCADYTGLCSPTEGFHFIELPKLKVIQIGENIKDYVGCIIHDQSEDSAYHKMLELLKATNEPNIILPKCKKVLVAGNAPKCEGILKYIHDNTDDIKNSMTRKSNDEIVRELTNIPPIIEKIDFSDFKDGQTIRRERRKANRK